MGKVVFVADLHLHPYRLCSRDGGHDRLLDGLSALRQSLDLARELCAPWVFAGDMKQPKTNWPQEALTGAHEILREYGDVVKVMVAGNHDAEGVGGSGLAPFRDCAVVVERTQVVLTGAAQLVCCPWNGTPADAAALLKENPGSVLVAHGFLQGCMLGPEDVRIAKGTPASEYGDSRVAVFGDVHKGQWRAPANPERGQAPFWSAYPPCRDLAVPFATVRPPGPWGGEVFYVGSTYQQNWGERNDPPKGALVVDADSGDVRLYPLASPRYQHFEVDEDGLPDLMSSAALCGGDFVRVVYTGKPCDALDDLRALGDQFRSFQLIPRRAERSVRRADVHAGMSTADLLRRYVEARPPADGADPGRVLEAGLRLAGGDA